MLKWEIPWRAKICWSNFDNSQQNVLRLSNDLRIMRKTYSKSIVLKWLRVEVLFWCSIVLLTSFSSRAEDEPIQPNILLIIADDLGWTDLSSDRATSGNGSDYYLTPNIDALAEHGIAFTQAYSCGPNCAPTRAALMSGLYAPRTGVYTVGEPNRGQDRFRKLIAARNKTSLDPEFTTLAERLKSAGYRTGHFGKWHLGNEGSGSGPTEQGFDINLGGTIKGSVSGGSRGHFAKPDGSFNLPGLEPNGKDGEFIADRLTTEAIRFMNGCGDRPFFTYLTHFSVHTPIQAPEVDQEFFNNISKGERHRNQTYAGMLKNLDDNVGRAIRFLETTMDPRNSGQHLIDNTVILFISDNGGLGGYKDAGVPGSPEITHQFPLKSGKGSLYEGGIRTPALIQWKGNLPAETVIDFPVITLDWHATLLSLAQIEIDQGIELDGMDLTPWLKAPEKATPERSLYWHFPAYLQSAGDGSTWRTTPGSVILRGPWKAHYYYESGEWELYNLESDIGEKVNLVSHEHEVASILAQDLLRFLIETQADLPLRKEDKKTVHLPETP